MWLSSVMLGSNQLRGKLGNYCSVFAYFSILCIGHSWNRNSFLVVWIMFKCRKRKFTFHTKTGLSSGLVRSYKYGRGNVRITAQVPAAIAPYPRWAAEPGVHCQTHCVEESETSHHGWEGWQNIAPNQNPAGRPLCFFKVQCLAKVTFIKFIMSSHTHCTRYLGQQENTANTNYGCSAQTSWARRAKKPDPAQSIILPLVSRENLLQKDWEQEFCQELEEDWFWGGLTYCSRAFSKWLAGQQ